MSHQQLAQEEVAMAAAADTTARIRAAASACLATCDHDRRAQLPPPWAALVPVAPMYSWQWPACGHPMMSSMGPVETRHTGSDERKHREDLQHELADLRSRFHELQGSYNELEKENQQLKTLRTGGSIAPSITSSPDVSNASKTASKQLR